MKKLRITQQKVLSNNRSLNNYFKDVNKLKRSTDLKDDKKTKDQLVNDNLLFVVSVAKQYQSLGIPIEDLISEGNIGLIEASDKFDGSKGNKFISYAVWTIRRKIIDFLNKNKRIVKVTAHNIRQLEEVRKAEDRLIKKLDRLPTLEEIYIELKEKINKEIIANLIELNLFSYSLDYTVVNEEEYSLEEKISNGDYEEIEEDNREVELKRKMKVVIGFVDTAFKSKPEYRDILVVHFGIDTSKFKDLEEVGKHYNLTQRQITRLLSVVLRKIRGRFKLRFREQLKDLI